MNVNKSHADSLIEKLNGLNLTPEEREVLGQLLIHDSTAEVEGFGGADYLANLAPVQGFNIGMPPSRDFNIGMPPSRDFNIGMPPSRDFNIGMPPARG